MIMYGLSLRDTERILTSIDCNNMFTNEDFNVLFGAAIAFYKGTNIKEYNDMIDYLQKNGGNFGSNDEPVRKNYTTIASLLMKCMEDTNVDAKFIEYFKNMKQFGNI